MIDLPARDDFDALKAFAESARGKRGYGSLAKRVRAYIKHTELAERNWKELYISRNTMIGRKRSKGTSRLNRYRRSAILAVFSTMSDDELKAYASKYVDVSGYMLPVERRDLEEAVADHIVNVEQATMIG